MFLSYLYFWSVIWVRIEFLLQIIFPQYNRRHCFIIFLFPILLLRFLVLSLHQSTWISSLFLEFWSFMIMSFDISLYSFTLLGSWKALLIWNLMSVSSKRSFLVLFLWWFPPHTFPCSLLSCHNQEVGLPELLIFSMVMNLHFLFDFWDFSSTFSSNHTIALFFFHFSDHNFQEFFTLIWRGVTEHVLNLPCLNKNAHFLHFSIVLPMLGFLTILSSLVSKGKFFEAQPSVLPSVWCLLWRPYEYHNCFYTTYFKGCISNLVCQLNSSFIFPSSQQGWD